MVPIGNRSHTQMTSKHTSIRLEKSCLFSGCKLNSLNLIFLRRLPVLTAYSPHSCVWRSKTLTIYWFTLSVSSYHDYFNCCVPNRLHGLCVIIFITDTVQSNQEFYDNLSTEIFILTAVLTLSRSEKCNFTY